MAIATLHRTFSRTLLLLGVISLVACGGGGGGKKAKDTTPEAFSFTASTNAATSAAVISPAVAITGIDAPAAVAITGGQYSINGGAFTAATGKVTSGQTIAVKVTASSVTNTPVEAILTVGGVRATFRVTTAPDLTPAAYNFAPTTDAALSTAITSAAITLSGFDLAVPISITNGEYSINGGAFTSAAGTISPAQTLAVKVISSNANSTPVEATLNVGGVTAAYRVTTLADAIPNAFTFAPATNVAPGSVNTSNPISVEGIEVATPISITAGEYSIDGGAFTAAAGTVTKGQAITVKAVAPAGTELTHNAVVTIGGVSGTYAVTTVPDTTAPVAEFKFPTPYTMSEASTVKVRGTATDDHAITSVKVVVNGTTEVQATPKAPNDFSSWTADVPLAAGGDNEIKVVATDDRNNATLIADANKVVIRQGEVRNAFPDEDNQFDYVFAGLVIDRNDGRNRLLITDSGQGKIIAVDIETGARTDFSDEPTENNQPFALAIDPLSQRLFVSSAGPLYEINILDGSIINKFDTGLLDNYYDMEIDIIDGASNLVFVESSYASAGTLAKFSLSDNQVTIISDESKMPWLKDVFGFAIDKGNNRYLIPVGGQTNNPEEHAVVAVDRSSGEHSVLSSNSVGVGEPFSGILPEGFAAGLYNAELDQKRNRVLVSEYPSKLFSIDLTTGNRTLFKDMTYKGVSEAYQKRVGLSKMQIDEENDVVFIVEADRNAIFLVDLETEERVFISKSAIN